MKNQSKEQLNKYAGEWVALKHDKVIAHNQKLNDLMQEIEEKNMKDKASVFLVPRKDEGPYILLIS